MMPRVRFLLPTIALLLATSAGAQGTGVSREPSSAARPAAPAARPRVIVTSPAAEPPAAARVLRLAETPLMATVLRAERTPRPVELSTGPVALEPGDLLVTRTPTAVLRRPAADAVNKGAERFDLPYQARFVDPQGVVRTARLVAEIAGGGLRMTRSSAGGFSGLVFLGLEDQDDRSRTYALPVPAQVIVTAPIDEVAPSRFDLDRTNAFVEVGLLAHDPPDEVRARVRASTDPQGLEVVLPVVRPRLSLRVSPRAIQGFGLEVATVEIVAEGLPEPGGRRVTLTATMGSLAPNLVELDSQGRGEARIRSITTGVTTVVGVSPPMRSDDATATFVPPWAFLIAALSGGAIGAAIRRAQSARRRERRRAAALDVLIGALVGTVVSALYAVGVNVLPVEPSATAGEALVFGLAALGGFLGLRIPKAQPSPE